MDDRNLLRIGGAAAVVGATLLFIGTFLHPAQADPNDALAAFQEYAADDLWVASHLTQFFGFALIVAGLVALSRSLSTGVTAGLARLAVAGSVASLALVAVMQAVDGVALKVMVDSWVNAPPAEKPVAFQAAFAVRQIEIGVVSLVGIVFGITVVLYGLAIALSHTYPKWLGWLAVISGVAVSLGGITTAYTGFSGLAMKINMLASSVLLVWFIIVGVLMWRRAAISASS